jgi:hypothetical protein
MLWRTIFFDEEGFARHEETFLKLGDLAASVEEYGHQDTQRSDA